MRIIQVEARSVAGRATCKAETIVIRPDPAVVTLAVPEVRLVEGERRQAKRRLSGKKLMGRRNTAYFVLLDDIRREEDESLILDHLVDRLFTLQKRMMREGENGEFDG